MDDTNVGLGMVPCRKGCKCLECRLERALAENAKLRNNLIQWGNGYVTCLACGHTNHGGESIPHDDGCIMDGYTKSAHDSPASTRQDHGWCGDDPRTSTPRSKDDAG